MSWRKGKLRIDGTKGVFEGEWQLGFRWNGWLMPRFDAETAKDILTMLIRNHKEAGLPDVTVHFEDDMFVVEGLDGDEVLYYYSDCDGMYDIGSCWMPWERAV